LCFCCSMPVSVTCMFTPAECNDVLVALSPPPKWLALCLMCACRLQDSSTSNRQSPCGCH
jgi:hypothetical protein